MSGFLVFIAVAPLCAVTILGMALLSWATRQYVVHCGTKKSATTATENKCPEDTGTNRRRSSSTLDTEIGDEVDQESYPKVTIQFLANQNQAALHDFLLHISLRIHWPVDRLEVLLSIDSDKQNKECNSRKDRRTRSGLTEDNYQLILNLMEEGFCMVVTRSPEVVLERPTSGSLLFSFQSICDIPHPCFVQEYLAMSRTCPEECNSLSQLDSPTDD